MGRNTQAPQWAQSTRFTESHSTEPQTHRRYYCHKRSLRGNIMFSRRKAEPVRQRGIVLAAHQQAVLLPNLMHLVTLYLGRPNDEVGNVVIGTMCRLTPDTAMSEIVVFITLQEELTAFQTNPDEYNRLSWSTHYTVANLGPDADDATGQISSEIASALNQANGAPTITQDGEAWWAYATAIDGYHLAKLIGINLSELAELMEHRYRNTGQWRGSLLDLRLALYYKAQVVKDTGASIEYASEGFQREVNDLLGAIAASQATEDRRRQEDEPRPRLGQPLHDTSPLGAIRRAAVKLD